MTDWMRKDVAEWVDHLLESYYLVAFIDVIHVNVRRDTVASEAFYVVLGVTPDRRREASELPISHLKAQLDEEIALSSLLERGLEKVGLIVADGLTGQEAAAARVLPRSDFQRCVTHEKIAF